MNCGLDLHKLTDNMDKILNVVKKGVETPRSENGWECLGCLSTCRIQNSTLL